MALAFAEKGLKVGLLDADIYGPSVPLLLEAESTLVKKSPNHSTMILPLTCSSNKNLKFLSFGHVNPKSGAPGSVRCALL
jgi:ATP-binding protein involved in chromosome partitioning